MQTTRPTNEAAGAAVQPEILAAREVVVDFPGPRFGFLGHRKSVVSALAGVDLDVRAGETIGLVGESGSGKSTLGRTLVGLTSPTAGSVLFKGRDIASFDAGARAEYRRGVQFIFQNPMASLDPKVRILTTVTEGLPDHMGGGADRRSLAAAVLESVGLGADVLHRFPHEFSGGQRQRIGIARALIRDPQVIVADEPTAALDVSIQAQIINLLVSIKEKRKLSLVFISHNLAVVGYLADRVAVMYLGKIIETGPAPVIMAAPQHPYTQALLSAVPVANSRVRSRRVVLQGEVPHAYAPPSGCRFRTRCPRAQAVCAADEPRLRSADGGIGRVACHFPGPRTDRMSRRTAGKGD